MKEKRESYFWTSYADLMTSLFFVMLVLFALAVTLSFRAKREANATKNELEKIQEIYRATEDIDSNYFRYSPEYRKHILNVEVEFGLGETSMRNLSDFTRQELVNAGKSIKRLVDQTASDSVQYLLIIEGQASRDSYRQNYELSYLRAYTLIRFWERMGISFGQNCEVLICGSGDGKVSGTGIMREKQESKNQRFLIHLVPKIGIIQH